MTTIGVRCEYASAAFEHDIRFVGPIVDVDAFFDEFVADDTPLNGGYVNWEFVDVDHLLSVEGYRAEIVEARAEGFTR